MADLHSSQKSKGIKYYEFKRTYQVTFSMYTVFPDYRGYVSQIGMRRADGELITDRISMVIIELNKTGDILDKQAEDMTPLDMWSAFFGYASDPKKRNLINDIMKLREAIGMAGAALMEISKDEHERAKFMSRRKFETDMTSNILTAEARGKAEGKAEGKLEALLEMVREMKADNAPVGVIARYTKLSIAEIENL